MEYSTTATLHDEPFWRRLVGNPIVRIVMLAGMLLGVQVGTLVLLKFLGTVVPALGAWLRGSARYPGMGAPIAAFSIATLVMALAYVPLYRRIVRWSERREPDEVSGRGAVREAGIGILCGFAIQSVVIAILWLAGAYRIDAVAGPAVLLAPFLVSVNAALFEEFLFRAVLFRIVERSLGSAIALAVSGLFFGLVHLGNPNATMLAAVAIAVEAGILLGAAYMATGRVWCVIGLHFAWNFFEGGVYSVPVSGFSMPGLFASTISGPALLTGGAFGVEASPVTVLVCLALAAVFLVHARRKGYWMQPFWRRPKPAVQAA